VVQARSASSVNEGMVLIETKTLSNGPVHGWLRVVRPEAADVIPVQLVVSCRGYADAVRQFRWNISPDTCKPGVDVGEVTLTLGKHTVWPGSGKTPGQENIDVE
jgi:hypothetical protein